MNTIVVRSIIDDDRWRSYNCILKRIKSSVSTTVRSSCVYRSLWDLPSTFTSHCIGNVTYLLLLAKKNDITGKGSSWSI